jgi:hypothetical protein
VVGKRFAAPVRRISRANTPPAILTLAANLQAA